MMRSNVNVFEKSPVIFLFSIITGCLMLIINVVRWALIDIVSPLVEPFIELIVTGLFFTAVVWSLVHVFVCFRKIGTRAVIPLIFNFVILAVILFVPFTTIMLGIDYNSNLDNRIKIVQMAESDGLGEMQSSKYTHTAIKVKLPEEFKGLSRGGGEILVEKKDGVVAVLFFTYRGILDNFSGFIYKSDDKPPKDDFGGEYFQIKKIKDNWYWAASS